MTSTLSHQRPWPELFELPFTFIPPTPTQLEAAAAAAALPHKVEALRGYLGAGKALTQKGNLKLADGRALAELLDTGDRFDPKYGDHTFRTTTTEHLPGLRSSSTWPSMPERCGSISAAWFR